MIQRLQSLYLLAIVVISSLLIFSDIPFYSETGKPVTTNEETGEQIEYESTTVTIDYNSTQSVDAPIGRNHTLIYFLGCIGLLSFITIFLYKNRKLQLRLVFGILVFTVIVFVSMYMLSFGNHYTDLDTQKSLLTGAGIPLALLVFAFLAYRRIGKDEKLVRSLDRIR
ncbi:MAG: putative membrane protein YedE/YeeE [Bacteroidia bacterium]|jgi:uncharacterized membrane protein YedE/YeeE